MNEKDAISNFLNEDSSRGDIFKEETPEVEEVEEEEAEEEKPLPFHRDPKVQKYVEKQIEKALSSRPSVEQQFKEEVTSSDVQDVIAAFTEIVGNDTPEKVRALKALEKTLQGSDERASQKAIERFQQQQQDAIRQQTEADNAALEELANGFEEIEETLGVDLTSNTKAARKLNEDFREYLKKIAPKDANGEVKSFPDIPAAFEEFQEKNKRPTASRAKELANRGLTRSNETASTAPAGRSWKDVDKFLSKLAAN